MAWRLDKYLDWHHIPVFLAVADTGSLSAAGRRLGISQPTAGRVIAALEADLGVSLFDRVPRGLRPTEAALDLIDRARTMQTAAAELQLLAEGYSDSLAGPVRVTASQVVATYVLPPILRHILQGAPEIEIELVSSNSTDNLLLGEADIAVRMVEPKQMDLIARKLGDLAIGLFAHDRYLAGAPPVTSPADLANHVFIGCDEDDLMLRAMARMGFAAQRTDFRLRTDDQVAHVEAVRAGVGIGATQSAIHAGASDIRQVLPDLPLAPLPVWLAAHKALQSSARVRHVYDALAAGLGAHIRDQRPAG